MFIWRSEDVEELYLDFIWSLNIKNVSAHGIHLFKTRVTRLIVHDRKFKNLRIGSQVCLRWRHHCIIQDTSRFCSASCETLCNSWVRKHLFIQLGHMIRRKKRNVMLSNKVSVQNFSSCNCITQLSFPRTLCKHVDMDSAFHIPLGIAKTLMITKDVLFTRYAIKYGIVGVLLCFFCRWYNAISSTFTRHCVCSRSLKDT